MRFSLAAVALAASSLASAASTSICDKYTTALLKENNAANQAALVTLLVKTAALGNFTGPGTKNPTLPGSMIMVPGILAPGTVGGVSVNLAKYFTGEVMSTNVNGKAEAIDWLDNGSVDDLTSNPTSAGTPGTHGNVLFSHLVSYFGVLLGCSMVGMTGFPAYAGSNDMAAVHQYMHLSEAEFTYFVEQVGMSAQSFGAAQADITTVAMALNSTFGMRCSPPAMVVPNTPKLPQAICQDSTCPMASGAQCAAYMMESEAATVTTPPASAPATIMPSTYMPTGTASMAAAASGSASAKASSSGAAAPLASAAGHVLAAGALVAALL